MVQAMRDLERTWNHKFNYPWTFFNDEPFNEVFKQRTKAETKAPCYYGEFSPSASCARRVVLHCKLNDDAIRG